VRLTPIEYRLLTLLATNAGRVLTHRQILREVWGPSHVEHEHYTRIYMGHLRRKLEADPGPAALPADRDRSRLPPCRGVISSLFRSPPPSPLPLRGEGRPICLFSTFFTLAGGARGGQPSPLVFFLLPLPAAGRKRGGGEGCLLEVERRRIVARAAHQHEAVTVRRYRNRIGDAGGNRHRRPCAGRCGLTGRLNGKGMAGAVDRDELGRVLDRDQVGCARNRQRGPTGRGKPVVRPAS